MWPVFSGTSSKDEKMVLVPSSHSSLTFDTVISQIDGEMKTILIRIDLDESIKALAYSQILDKYLKVKEQLQNLEPIKIVEE